jgi:DnaJ-class molecular chaperone
MMPPELRSAIDALKRPTFGSTNQIAARKIIAKYYAKPCPLCDGSPVVRVDTIRPGDHIETPATCPTCGGDGFVWKR